MVVFFLCVSARFVIIGSKLLSADKKTEHTSRAKKLHTMIHDILLSLLMPNVDTLPIAAFLVRPQKHASIVQTYI